MIRTMLRAAGAGIASLILITACTESGSLVEPPVEVAGPSLLVTSGLSITNLEASSGGNYQVVDAGVEAGAKRYTDRSYTLKAPVPSALRGLTFIRTPNDDKNANPGSADFLSFDVDRDVVVYVGHDDRVDRPAWLTQKFTDTGLDMVDGDQMSGTFSVFSAEYGAGTVTLGSNAPTSTSQISMYTVVVEPQGSSGSDTQAPTVPADLSATAASDTRIDLSWSASSDDVGVAGYHVYRGGSQVADVSGTSYSDTGLSASTTYDYKVSAYDAAGHESARSSTASATTKDGGSSGPLTVSNLQVESSSSYGIADSGLEAGAVRYSDRRYTFESPVPSSLKGLTFIRTANDDKDANPGDASFLSFDVDQDVTVFVVHDDRATLPAWLRDGFTDTGMDLLDSDRVSEAFSVFSASFPAGTVTLGSNVPDNASGMSMYSVVIRAEGSGSGDTEAPAAPTGLSATAASSSRIDLGWTASTDNVGVSGYRVYRDGTQIADVGGTSYSDTGLTAATMYSYTVAAYDAAGNVSGKSSGASATTESGSSGRLALSNLTVESPSRYEIVEEGLDPGDRRYTDRSYTFESPIPSQLDGKPFIQTANDDKDDNPGDATYLSFDANQDVTVYVVHDDRARIPDWMADSFKDTGMDLQDSDPNSEGFSVYSATFPAGTVTLGSNLAADDQGLSMYSVVVRGSGDGTSDTEAPTAPTELTASPVSSSRIDLGWTASTDNVGVAGYYVYRNGKQVADVSGTSYSDTGLSASTTYRYRVAAYDAAGNVSTMSTSASATTGSGSDTQAPSAPTDLSAAAASTSRIDLQWTASRDNVGVAGYNVYRDGAQVADVSGTSYSDTGLSASTTYRYRVAAYDAAGNVSPKSTAASATTESGSSTGAIRDITFDFSTHKRRAPGSDNWPTTWAEDGNQYTTWGDGGGFDGSNTRGRVSIGVGRVEGTRSSYTGYNVNGGYNAENSSSFSSGKSVTIFFVDGALYMMVAPQSFGDNCGGVYCAYAERQLWKSTDYGAHWSEVTGTAWRYADGETIGFHQFINMGRAYNAAIDGYVYMTAIEIQNPSATQIQAPGELILMRVPRGSIENKSAYEYFSGTPSSPAWSSNFRDRRPVVTDPEGFARHSITYIPQLDRFIMLSPHSGDDTGNLKVWEAPKPWGPWSLVKEYREDNGTGWNIPGQVQKWYFWDVSSKWISNGGTSIVITATGKEGNDSWNTVEATLTVK